MDAILRELSADLNGAELTCCFLRLDAVEDGPIRLLNVWICLRFLPEKTNDSFAFLTGGPQTTADSKVQLLATHSQLSLSNALRLIGEPTGMLRDPAAPSGSGVKGRQD